jgi:serine/threonine-protein kinase
MTTHVGRYEILEEVGRGAMGVVYKARDPVMDRVVAVKTIVAGALSGPQAGEYRDRFVREARAAGRFVHPGIVTVHDAGEHEGTPFLVMEFVTGRTLADALASGERFPVERICEIGQELADALGYAHTHGVIHRDVKPANVMLAAAPRSGERPGAPVRERARLTDFGVAKIAAAQATGTGQMLGTPSFMAPEHFTGAPLDGRSDLFSLGVLLYWLATGEKPFAGDTITAVSYRIINAEVIPPRRLNPAVPAELERIILKLLQKDPALRYPNGAALAADLSALRGVSAARETAVPQTAIATSLSTRLADQDIPVRPQTSPAAAEPSVPALPVPVTPNAGYALARWQTLLLAVLAVAVIALLALQLRSGAPAPSVAAPEPPAAGQGEPPGGPRDAKVAAPPESAEVATSRDVAADRTTPARSAPGPAIAPQPGAPITTPPPAAQVPAPQPAVQPAAPPPTSGVVAGPPPAVSVPSAPPADATADIRRQVEAGIAAARAAETSRAGSLDDRPLMRLLAQPVPPDRSRVVMAIVGLPPSLPFLVQMDGQPLYRYQGGAAARSRSSQAVAGRTMAVESVAPGTHTFRILLPAGSIGGVPSSSVSAAFQGGQQRILVVQFTGDPSTLRDPAARRAAALDLKISIE